MTLSQPPEAPGLSPLPATPQGSGLPSVIVPFVIDDKTIPISDPSSAVEVLNWMELSADAKVERKIILKASKYNKREVSSQPTEYSGSLVTLGDGTCQVKICPNLRHALRHQTHDGAYLKVLFTGLAYRNTALGGPIPSFMLARTSLSGAEGLTGAELGGTQLQEDSPPHTSDSEALSTPSAGEESHTPGPAAPVRSLNLTPAPVGPVPEPEPLPAGPQPSQQLDPRFRFVDAEVKVKVLGSFIACVDQVFDKVIILDDASAAAAAAEGAAFLEEMKKYGEYDATHHVHQNLTYPDVKFTSHFLKKNYFWRGVLLRHPRLGFVKKLLSEAAATCGPEFHFPDYMAEVLAYGYAPDMVCITVLDGSYKPAVGVVAATRITAGTFLCSMGGHLRALRPGDVPGQKLLVAQRPMPKAAFEHVTKQAAAGALTGICSSDNDPKWVQVPEIVLDASGEGEMKAKCVAAYMRLAADAGKQANVGLCEVLVPWAPTLTLLFTTCDVFKGQELLR